MLQALDFLDARPPLRAFLTGFSSKQVVELVDIDADEIDEVAVEAREVLSEIPDDSVELGDERAQLLAKIYDFPEVGLRQVCGLLHEEAVDVAVLDDPEQVHSERSVDLVHYFFENCL